VARNQRERILAAVAEAASDGGYAEASVEDIIARAGVSRRTFYDLFNNKQHAFLAAYDEAVRRLVKGVRDAQREGRDFGERITMALGTFLELLAASPAFARMCIVEVLAAGPKAVERRNSAMEAFAALIEEDARTLARSRPQSPIMTEVLVGGIYETVYTRVAAGRIDELEGLLPELVYAVLVPYVGEEAAASARQTVRERSGRSTPGAATAA
jgi:AcrR family transcriptional regulator